MNSTPLPLIPSLCLALVSLCSPFVRAERQVDLREGSYNWIHRDEVKTKKGEAFTLLRSYSSRSDFRGILGLGWCTQLEWTWIEDGPRSLLVRCDQVQAVSASQVQRRGSDILLTWENQTLTFTRRGQLRELRERGSQWVFARDVESRITLIQSRRGSLLNLNFDHSIRMLSAIQGAQRPLHFFFANGQLARAGLESYHYDRFGNLTQVREGKAVIEEVRYEVYRDLVLAVRDSGDCWWRYDYTSVEKSDRVEDVASRTRECPGKVSPTEKTKFSYRKTKQNGVVLERIAETGGRP